MFGIFRKKSKPKTLMDQLIHTMYGDNPPKKLADATDAGTIAADELLGGAFDKAVLIRMAKELNAGPIPYSTHDLAASVALSVLKNIEPASRPQLFEIQLLARMTVSAWFKDGKIVRALAQSFESTLYEAYKPKLG